MRNQSILNRYDHQWSAIYCQTTHLCRNGYQNTVTVWNSFVELNILDYDKNRREDEKGNNGIFSTGKKFLFSTESDPNSLGSSSRLKFWAIESVEDALFLAQCLALASSSDRIAILTPHHTADRLEALRAYSLTCDKATGEKL